MKVFGTIAAAFLLLGGPAFAQATGTPQTQGGSTAPVTQQGSGQSAGGPAKELNSPTGGAPIQGSGPAATGSSNSRQPATQQGSGQQSGGPAAKK